MSRCVSCCAVFAALSVTAFCQRLSAQEPPPPDTAPLLVRLEDQISRALDGPATLQFVDQPLGDVVAFLEDRHKFEIQLDTTALDGAGVTTDTPVTIDVEGISLRSALNLMLKQIELTYVVHDGVLLITTEDETSNSLVTEVYDASHFLYVPDRYGARKRDADFLFDLVSAHVWPTTWTDVGGTGSLELLDHAMVVSQAWDVQQEVRQFMRAIELAYEQHAHGEFKQIIEVGTNDSSATKAIYRGLGEATTMQFLEQPLSDVVSFIEDRHKFEIQLDTNALDSAGVTPDTPVTIDVEGLPLANALALMLKQIELSYRVSDEVLLITTTDEIENVLPTRIYPVQDLLEAEAKASGAKALSALETRAHGDQFVTCNFAAPILLAMTSPYGPTEAEAGERIETAPTTGPNGSPTPAAEENQSTPSGGGGFPGALHPRQKALPPAEQLIQLITCTIAPTDWTDVGGTGAITYAPQFHGIVISQTQENHAKIEALLAKLRRLQPAEPAAAENAAPEATGADSVSLRAYRVYDPEGKKDAQDIKDVNALSELLAKSVEPELWRQSTGEYFMRVVDQTLVVRAPNAVHDRIDEFLIQTGLAVKAPRRENSGGYYGAGGGR